MTHSKHLRLVLLACAFHLLFPSASYSASATTSPSASAPLLRVYRAPLSSWRFRSLNGSIDFTNVTTPGTSHTHLLSAGVLSEDPYHRFHERDYQWVATTTWVYETTLPPFLVNATSVRVVFESLDGVAHVALNNQSLGVAVNAFRPHTFALPIEELQSETTTHNALQITFTPPLAYMEQQAHAYPYDVPATRNFNVWAEPTHRPFLRKAGSDFGWDWGPAFVTTGIAGDAYIEWVAEEEEERVEDRGDQVRLVELNVVYTFPSATDFSVVRGHVSVDIDSVAATLHNVTLQLVIDNKPHGAPVVVTLFADRTPSPTSPFLARTEASLPFEVKNPSLWWPAGSGVAHLYDVRIDAYAANSTPVATLSHRVGFRRVELIQQPTQDGGVPGTTFLFRINGVPLFMKGANWIPNDSFPTRVPHAKVTFLLQSVLAANMNMLRVWGGGRYESDAFYESCDQLGLLVWHEFMFACAMYPRDQGFVTDIQHEVEFQIRRLRKFTSLAIWGGNNENENMMASFANGDFELDEPFNRDVAVADFTKLFVETIRPLVESLDFHQRPYVDTSPSNGLLSSGDPYVKRWGNNTNDIAYGDVHYYNYAGDCQDHSQYPHARFISEFGFQSVPSLDSLDEISDPEDWRSFQSFWKLLKFRERHANGTREMTTQLQRRFHVPFPFLDEHWMDTPLDHGTGFALDVRTRVASFVYLTQIQQALCYTTAIEAWRRGRNPQLGGTMGILYWQLNDVWQGTSWSSIEFSGRWKSLQYAVKKAFAPVMVTLSTIDEDTLVLYGVNDQKDCDVVVELVYELIATDSGRVLSSSSSSSFSSTSSFSIPRLSSELLDRISISSLFHKTPECDPTHCLLRVRCLGSGEEGDRAANSCAEDVFHFFAPFKQLALRHGRVAIENVELLSDEPLVADVTLRSENFVALFVELEASCVSGYWSCNSFHLVGNATQTLRFTAAAGAVVGHGVRDETRPWTQETLAQQLQLRWLQQTYETEELLVSVE